MLLREAVQRYHAIELLIGRVSELVFTVDPGSTSERHRLLLKFAEAARTSAAGAAKIRAVAAARGADPAELLSNRFAAELDRVDLYRHDRGLRDLVWSYQRSRAALRHLDQLLVANHIGPGAWQGGIADQPSAVNMVTGIHGLTAQPRLIAPDLVLEFRPGQTGHVAAAARALGDQLRTLGWRDPAQIDAATGLVQQAATRALRYLEGDDRPISAEEQMTVRVTLRVSTDDAGFRSLHVSVEGHDRLDLRRFTSKTFKSQYLAVNSTVVVGPEVEEILHTTTTRFGVRAWGEVYADFVEPQPAKWQKRSDVADTALPQEYAAKARIVQKVYDDHHIRVTGWQDVELESLEILARTVDLWVMEEGGPFDLRQIDIMTKQELPSLGQGMANRDHFSTVVLSKRLLNDPAWALEAQNWARDTEFGVETSEDFVAHVLRHELNHIKDYASGPRGARIQDGFSAALQESYAYYDAQSSLPLGMEFTDWQAQLPRYAFQNADRSLELNPNEATAEGGMYRFDPNSSLLGPGRIAAWQLATGRGRRQHRSTPPGYANVPH